MIKKKNVSGTAKPLKFKTFKSWLYSVFPEQKDSLVISEDDEKMLKSAFAAGRQTTN